MRRSQKEIEAHIEKLWEEFWLPLFASEEIDAAPPEPYDVHSPYAKFIAQIKKELADYHDIMSEASKVYHDLTAGNISKPNTMASDVISVAEAVRQDQTREEIQEWIEFAETEYAGYNILEITNNLKEHFNIPNEEQ